MPVSYQVDLTHRRIRITVRDAVTVAQLQATVDRQLADDMWTFGVLVDLRLINRPTSLEDLHTFAAHVRQLVDVNGPRGPVAIVATNAAALGAAHIYAHFSGRADRLVDVFWSLEEAEQWLDGFEARSAGDDVRPPA